MAIDEGGRDEGALEIDHLATLPALPHAGDEAARDRDVGLVDLGGEHVDEPASAQDEVGGPVPPCDRDQLGSLHGRDATRCRFAGQGI